MNFITIFTPTYNRAYILPKLYDSLCRQTNKDFIWFVVDDGSIDNTEMLINKWKAEKKIEIVFFKQKNSGKMIAHNYCVQHSLTEYFVCVDSDDFLFDDAVALIYDNLTNIQSNNMAGLIFPRKMMNADNLHYEKKELPKITTLHNLYKQGFFGETTLVFKTRVIKQFLFPEIESEKFITEAFVYDQIDQKYEYIFLNKNLVVCEYVLDGYTRNLSSRLMGNPKGCALYYNQYIQLYAPKGIEKLKMIALYIMYSKLGDNGNVYKNSNCRSILYFIAWILSYAFLYKLRKKRKKI